MKRLHGTHDNHVSYINISEHFCFARRAAAANGLPIRFLPFCGRQKFIHTLNLQANYHNIFREQRDAFFVRRSSHVMHTLCTDALFFTRFYDLIAIWFFYCFFCLGWISVSDLSERLFPFRFFLAFSRYDLLAIVLALLFLFSGLPVIWVMLFLPSTGNMHSSYSLSATRRSTWDREQNLLGKK